MNKISKTNDSKRGRRVLKLAFKKDFKALTVHLSFLVSKVEK